MVEIMLPYTHAYHGKAMDISLWGAQIAVFGLYASGGVMKLVMPVPKLATMFPWTGQVSKPFLRLIGVLDLAGGIGILVPEATHIVPQLTAYAALGGGLLQVCAIVFHLRRGEPGDTPFNFFLLALCVFVLWGR